MKIILIGLPNTGKSLLGASVAQQLDLPFIDVDRLIEKNYQAQYQQETTVAAIRQKLGENSFRQFETETLKQLCNEDDCVIAPGGGCVLRTENHQLLASLGTIVYLSCTFDLFKQRLERYRKPLFLLEMKAEALQAEYALRVTAYAKVADFTIEIEEENPEILCERIVKTIYPSPVY